MDEFDRPISEYVEKYWNELCDVEYWASVALEERAS